MTHERNASSGFTLIEVAVVCAIIGVLALLAYPNMVRLQAQQKTKAGATQMAGVIQEARSRASNEATPYLVYFNEPTVDGNGGCGPAATMVRDSDRTYSISAGDDVRDIPLPEGACENVKQYDAETAESPALVDLILPVEDMSTRALEVLGLTATATGNGNSGNGKGNGGPNGSKAKIADVVVNGATFPIDAESGRPVLAFSERGIPVDPSNPADWGSGAGALYVTDGSSNVYAAIVQPLGNVQLRSFDGASGEWR